MNSTVPPRRRTERACQQCRRKKVKCSGHQDCSTCTELGLDCTFEPNPTERAYDPTHVEQLEQTIRELQANIKSTSLSLHTKNDNKHHKTNERNQTTSHHLQTLTLPAADVFSRGYGSCCGIEILRRMRVKLDITTGLSSIHSLGALTNALDRPLQELGYSPTFSPPKSDLLRSVNAAFEKSLLIRSFIDQNTIETTLHGAYDTTAASTTLNQAQDEMALIYALAAIGQQLDGDLLRSRTSRGGEIGWEGLTFFRAARGLVEPSSCERGLIALQTVVCMAIFLVATSSFTRAYMFIRLGAAAAVRLGLHSSWASHSIPRSEQIQRERTLRTIRALDTYVGTFLGLPCCCPEVESKEVALPNLRQKSLDSSPRSGDDDMILVDKCMEAFDILRNASHALFLGALQPEMQGCYSVSGNALRQHNGYLEQWILSAANMGSSTRLNALVRQTGAYAQMVLNSPFLHYLAFPGASNYEDGHTAAKACLNAAIQTVEDLKVRRDDGSLDWVPSLSLRSLVIASITLLTVELDGLSVPSMEQIRATSDLAEKLLGAMAVSSVTAFGCLESLQPLYHMKRSIEMVSTNPTIDISTATTNVWISSPNDTDLPLPSHPLSATGSFSGYPFYFHSMPDGI